VAIEGGFGDDGFPKINGFGVAVVCAVIAAVHAPGLTHHLHWKATFIWVIVAVVIAALASAFLPDKT
jgi:MFS-type transporter involved in bile tolerance (Atg22 family)